MIKPIEFKNKNKINIDKLKLWKDLKIPIKFKNKNKVNTDRTKNYKKTVKYQ